MCRTTRGRGRAPLVGGWRRERNVHPLIAKDFPSNFEEQHGLGVSSGLAGAIAPLRPEQAARTIVCTAAHAHSSIGEIKVTLTLERRDPREEGTCLSCPDTAAFRCRRETASFS